MTATWQEKIAYLEERQLSIVIEKNGKTIFESVEPMLKPLYICLNEKADEMNRSIVIDKIVGRAAAFLCVLGKVSAVYTPVASDSALEVLEKAGIELKARKKIPHIMNRDNTDFCPMEKLAGTFTSAEDFYQKLKNMIEK
ncbi:DUF1893 domain-containing protein [candidate division KSB1 bacterium]|nr:DUF1893 domain-containing protein [candidate division KSB1 bacterium]